MSVTKKDGKWVARTEVGSGQDRIQKQKTFSTKREAEAWIREMQSKRDTFTKHTVATFWDNLYIPYIRDRVRPITFSRYAGEFDRLIRPVLGDYRLSELKAADIQRQLDRLESYGAKVNFFKDLRQMLRKARDWDMVQSVATDGCDLPDHRRKPIEIADPSMLPKYLEAVKRQNGDILAGVAVSMMGARRSEVCGVQWDDITFLEDGTAEVYIRRSVTMVDRERVVAPTKTQHSERVLIAPKWIADVLRHESMDRIDDTWIMPYTPDGYSKAWRKCVEASGLPWVSLKNLRHTVGTALVDSGCSLTDVQNWLGHDLPTTTAKFYLQRTQNSIRRASNILDGLCEPEGEREGESVNECESCVNLDS